tara:strand:- start:961 stop:1911 length:951 start_codon:yes stop_codon:yes gene_type:complete
MNKTYFEIIRSGINSTFQDLGRENLYHIGIPFSGAMDKRNFLISNALTGNKKDTAALEFAYQGPLMKLKNGKINFAITGDVNFNIIRNSSKIEKGNCYQTYNLEHDEQIDIISTNKSIYGYFSIKGEFDIKPFWGSCSINTKAKIGPNDGNKISKNQKIYLNNVEGNFNTKKLNYINSKIEYIRVIKGTNFNYFSENAKKFFFNEKFTISKLSDRMGMRLEGKKIENIVDTNIKSEGLIRGVIQIPGDGNPIIMLSDHGTIGGYPKIAVVISADYDKLVQLQPASKIKFKSVELPEAEKLYNYYNIETESLIKQIS